MWNIRLGIISLFTVLAVAITLFGLAGASQPSISADLVKAAAGHTALPDLTGIYHGDDQGVYYLRQIGNNIYWYGQEADQYGNIMSNPSWSNIAFGTISGNTIKLNWADVPNGQTSNSGTLTLTVSYTGGYGRDQTYILQVTQQTGGFGGTRLTRSIPA